MSSFSSPHDLARRDWIKAAGLTSVATLLASVRGISAPVNDLTKPRVRGVVFMVADGMSPGVLTMAQNYAKLIGRQGTHWCRLMHDANARHGLMDTASASSLVTDSAAASSAWGGGQRVNNGEINVDTRGNDITPIAALLKKSRRARIGLVTTATVTHATPAGFAASISARGDELMIAPQYLERVDVVLGGGSGYFDPRQRPDKRDLGGDFIKAGYQMVSNRKDMLASKSEKLLGLFNAGHLPFAIDRAHDSALAEKIPTLSDMAMAALSRFLADDRPFLLQVEGARVDHAAHLNDIAGLLGEQLAFDDALGAVLAAIAGRDDILVVVTSDHGNSNPGLSGTGNAYGESTERFSRITRMTASHEKIFLEWMKVRDGGVKQLTELVKKYLGFNLEVAEAEALVAMLGKRKAQEWSRQLSKPEGLLGQFSGNHTAIGWIGTSHTSDPTIITAVGPLADRFSGLVVNSDVFKHLMEALG